MHGLVVEMVTNFRTSDWANTSDSKNMKSCDILPEKDTAMSRHSGNTIVGQQEPEEPTD
jgi:hypothetical protein